MKISKTGIHVTNATAPTPVLVRENRRRSRCRAVANALLTVVFSAVGTMILVYWWVSP